MVFVCLLRVSAGAENKSQGSLTCIGPGDDWRGTANGGETIYDAGSPGLIYGSGDHKTNIGR